MNRADYRRLRKLERQDVFRHSEEIRRCAYADCFQQALSNVIPVRRMMPRPAPSQWASFLAMQALRRARVVSQVQWRKQRAALSEQLCVLPEPFRSASLPFACGPEPAIHLEAA